MNIDQQNNMKRSLDNNSKTNQNTNNKNKEQVSTTNKENIYNKQSKTRMDNFISSSVNPDNNAYFTERSNHLSSKGD